MEFKNILQFPWILQNWVNEANMSQLAQEKQVNLGTSARLNALSQYVVQISSSVMKRIIKITYVTTSILFHVI